ncbi:MAG: sulfatase-like hydrolase/transferase [Thermoanaerobaculia bacterium]|nr:sulfatase-like hydrolase/transferase [Thermoanaerobaculia bacterium]
MHETLRSLLRSRQWIVFGLVAIALAVWWAEAPVAESKPSAKEAVPTGERPDVVLITLDTLRADTLGFAGHPGVETPLLDRLAREGAVFRRAYAHNVVTLPSHSNILTGLYPHQHGVRENSGFVLGEKFPTLATRLRDAGYATGAFIGAYPLDSRFGLDRGFDIYDDSYSVGLDPRNPSFPERRGDEVVASALRWWRQAQGAPRFLWLHLYDPHAPYDPPEPWRSKYRNRPYLGEVAATDAFLRPLVEPILDRAAASSKGSGAGALVVVTSDHGEGLGEHGETTHGLFVYEPTLRVPLILWGAGVERRVSDSWVGHIDIAPTIYESVGLVARELPGRSLLRAVKDAQSRRLYFEALSAFFNRGWAPLRGLVGGRSDRGEKAIELPIPELYDLLGDPGEANNLAAPASARYREIVGMLPTESWPPTRGELDREEIEALRALGYVTEEAPRREAYTEADDPKRLIHLDRKYHESVDAYHRRDLQRAESLTRQILAERPDMTNAYGILVMTLREAGRPGEAVALLEAAVAEGRANDEMLLHLGSTYAELGRSRKAIEVLEPLAHDGHPAILATLGIAHSDAGDHQTGKRILEDLLADSPDDTQAHEKYGVVLLRLRQPAAAQTHFERALELNDGLSFSWNNLGVARAWQGDERGALVAWQRAIALDPKLFDALYNLGMTAAKLGENEVARSALAQYVESAPVERFGPDVQRAQSILDALP